MNNKKRGEFLDANLFGAILRFFVKDPKDLDYCTSTMMTTLRKLVELIVAGRYFISRIDVLVQVDQNYKDADCGQSANILRSWIAEDEAMRDVVYVTEVEGHDIFVGLLNFGLELQREHGMTHHLSLSWQAHSYVNEEMANDTICSLIMGDKIACMRMHEFAASIDNGEVVNTCCTWDSTSLKEVGDFPLAAARPKIGEESGIFFIDPVTGDKEAYGGGIEEGPPAKDIADKHGKCIGVIIPRGVGIPEYIRPEQGTPEYERDEKKRKTKDARKDALYAYLNTDRAVLRNAVVFRSFDS